MLEIRNINKTFNPGTINANHALKDLSLDLADGESVAVIGGNGAGKSTLLNAVAGVWNVDSGTIRLGDVDVTHLPEFKRAKYIGRVFQDPMMGTAANMQIEENLALAARRGQSRSLRQGITKAEREQFRELLKILDLGLENRLTDKVGLLYDKSQAGSIKSIEDAKKYCDENGIEYVEKTGTTTPEIQAAADALVAEKVDAIFTPQDNTIMTAELAIFEKFTEAGIPHYTGADSFALNGAFCGYGVNYTNLGVVTADMVVDVLVNGADPATTPVNVLSDGIITINTETAEAVGIDFSVFAGMGSELIETVTAKEFE